MGELKMRKQHIFHSMKQSLLGEPPQPADADPNTLDVTSRTRVWTLEPNCLGLHLSSATSQLHGPG